jgi:sodium-dependent dicarboxylate transporter 2/3/5
MALGELMFSTGLAHWIGAGLAGVFQTHSVIGLTLLFAAVGIIVSETTTNTASATMVVPIAIAVSQAAGVDPLKPALAACLGCSMGFLLPVSTGPNAMAYGTGCVPLRAMMRHGIWLDVVGWIVIVASVLLLGPTLPAPR